MNDSDLWDALHDRMARLNEVAEAADGIPADTDVAWTARTMKAAVARRAHAGRMRRLLSGY
jgi:hypothetical protein